MNINIEETRTRFVAEANVARNKGDRETAYWMQTVADLDDDDLQRLADMVQSGEADRVRDDRPDPFDDDDVNQY